jgi:hypothetical protein
LPTLSVAPQNIPPGALRFSASRTIPAITHDVMIRLTDTGDWATKAGNVLIWGYQVSTDGGATWKWRQWQPGRPDPTNTGDGNVLPFGTVGKDGLLPALRIAGTDVVADANNRVRLAIQVDTAIVLGADISTV